MVRDTKAGAVATVPRHQGPMTDARAPHIPVDDDRRETRDAVTT